MTRDVCIDIDEIVFEGVDVSDLEAFRAALGAELTGLAAGHRREYPGGTASVLHGAPVVQSAADSLGADVARSAWSSIVPRFGGGPA